jgi:hypothetical protein
LRCAGILIAIPAGWFAVIIAATAAFGPVGPAVLVLGPDIPARLPEGAGILRAGNGRTVVTAPDAAFVRRLYANGAWVVLPALRNGCMDLRLA